MDCFRVTKLGYHECSSAIHILCIHWSTVIHSPFMLISASDCTGMFNQFYSQNLTLYTHDTRILMCVRFMTSCCAMVYDDYEADDVCDYAGHASLFFSSVCTDTISKFGLNETT